MSWSFDLLDNPGSPVTMPDPSSIANVCSREVEHYSFSDGSYVSSDIGDAGETIVLTGILSSDDLLSDVEAYIGSKITVSGLSDSNLDGDYLVEDFSVEYPEGLGYPEWNLSLRKN